MEMLSPENQEIINTLNKHHSDSPHILVKKVKEIFDPVSYENAAEILTECRKNHKKLVPLVEGALRYKF